MSLKFQVSVLEDVEDEEGIEEADRTQNLSTTIGNTTHTVERTVESGCDSERNLTLESDRQKKKWASSMAKNADGCAKMLKASLKRRLNLEIDKTFLLDEGKKTEMTHLLKQAQVDVQKLNSEMAGVVSKLKIADVQFVKELVSEFEKIYPGGASGGGIFSYKRFTLQNDYYFDNNNS